MLDLLCAGAAKGVVDRLQAAFTAETGKKLASFFSAVGAIKEKFLAGEACDVLVLSKVLIDQLTTDGLLVEGSSAPIGVVRTGLAVRDDEPVPPIARSADLAATLLAASGGIFVPDTERSTAGIHVMGMMRQMGIADAVAPRLKTFPNGETAMRHLAQSTEPHAIGSTQVTEINNTPGIKLIGYLPAEHELSTVYSVAVSAKSSDPEGAKRLVEWLTGPRSADLRAECGFDL